MRNLIKFAGIFVVLGTIGLSFTVCNEPDNGNINNKTEPPTSQTPTPGLSFTPIDGTAYAVSIGTATDVNIVIPATYNNLPVTMIKYQGFLNSAILSVTFPNSISIIENEAFYGCTRLTNVTIGNSVTIIGHDAFSNCTSLTSVTIGNGIYLFSGYVFANCTSLTSITIENGLAVIGVYTFYNCTGLRSITIPNSVTSIGNETFTNTGIWNNTSDNNVVYADKWVVGYKGTLGTLSIKEGTVGISYLAFSGSSLTNITIPNSVTSIGGYAFKGWTSTQKIIIPFTTLAQANAAWNNSFFDWRASCNAKIINNAGIQLN